MLTITMESSLVITLKRTENFEGYTRKPGESSEIILTNLNCSVKLYKNLIGFYSPKIRSKLNESENLTCFTVPNDLPLEFLECFLTETFLLCTGSECKRYQTTLDWLEIDYRVSIYAEMY